MLLSRILFNNGEEVQKIVLIVYEKRKMISAWNSDVLRLLQRIAVTVIK